jgi:hypothetical protein
MKTFLTAEAQAEWAANWKLVLASAVGTSMASIAVSSTGTFRFRGRPL